MTPSERHNQLGSDFVMTVIRKVLNDGGDINEVMVVIESLLLAAMLTNSKVFKVTPAVSSGLVEAAVQRAIERYAALEAKP